MEATTDASQTPQAPQVPTGLGQATSSIYAPATLPPIEGPPLAPFPPAEVTPPGPAVVADTTPIVSGIEVPPPVSAIVPVQVPPVVYTPPAPPVAPAPTSANIPTWAWVLGGVALLGLLGFIAWTVTRPAVTPTGMTKSNPLMRGEATRRRFRRARRAKRRSGR